MTSKWFKQFCELNCHDMDMILDRIVPLAKEDLYWEDIYTSIVFEYPLTMQQVVNISGRFVSVDTREARRLVEKLERLRSQS